MKSKTVLQFKVHQIINSKKIPFEFKPKIEQKWINKNVIFLNVLLKRIIIKKTVAKFNLFLIRRPESFLSKNAGLN